MEKTDREKHIENITTLKAFLEVNPVFKVKDELYQSLDYAISSLKTDEAYQLMYEGEEIYTKADMVAMLTELQTEIEKQKRDELSYQQTWNYPLNVCVSIIQQKINALKENEDGNK